MPFKDALQRNAYAKRWRAKRLAERRCPTCPGGVLALGEVSCRGCWGKLQSRQETRMREMQCRCGGRVAPQAIRLCQECLDGMAARRLDAKALSAFYSRGQLARRNKMPSIGLHWALTEHRLRMEAE